jgi:para-nitrobenzyl esterase
MIKSRKLIVSLGAIFAIIAQFAGVPPARAQKVAVPPLSLDSKGARAQEHDISSKLTPSTNAAIVTEDGPVKGFQFAGNEQAQPNEELFLGIPYAAPPVGDLRWMPPQPHGKFDGVLRANSFGNRCAQPDGNGGVLGTEDCLTLNLYSPLDEKNQNKKHPLPVMVWIHGGSLVAGGSPDFDPSPLVSQGNVIVVTINYRLGLLGFFAHPAIDAEGHLNGNYGLMDQQFALQWVQRNIGAFGGDPNRVTIFGESAGGQSVYFQLASPLAAGLYQRAIAESGAVQLFQGYFNNIVPLANGESVGGGGVPSGIAIAEAVGCPDQTARCLRGIPASTLALAAPAESWPFVDGSILPQTPDSAFASGKFNRVPVISGSNHDELRVGERAFADSVGLSPITDAKYPQLVAALIGLPVDHPLIQLLVNIEYPLTIYPAPAAPLAFGAMFTDLVIACPTRNADRLLSSYVTTYTYEFADENAPALSIVPGDFPFGAYHGSEIQYLFDRFHGVNPFTPDQQKLSNIMIGYWTQFASTGDPNFAGAPVWAPYSSRTDQYQSLVPPTPGVDSTFDSFHKCSSLWSGS